MKSIWSDLVDSVQTNHGNAAVKLEGDRVEIAMNGVTIVATKAQDGHVDVDVSGQERVRFESSREAVKDARYHVYDELNKIWAANQKPRTSRGGPSYSGGGGGDDDVVAIGDMHEGHSDDGDDD